MKEAIQSLARKYIEESLVIVQPKRRLFREYLRKYIATPEEGKVTINVLYSYIQTFAALGSIEEQAITWEPRGLYDDEQADNLNKVCGFDASIMDIGGVKKQQLLIDIGMFGVGLRMRESWDSDDSVVEVCIKDPLSWLPDPTFDHMTKPRFHFFEEMMSKSEMTAEYGFDKAAVSEAKEAPTNEMEQTEQTQKRNSGMQGRINYEGFASVYNGYMYYDEDLYLVTLSSDMVLLRCEKLEPIDDYEKEEGIDIRSVVNVTWLSPRRGDPYGTNLCEIIIPKQDILREFINLQVVNAKYGVFGQTYLYDSQMIGNNQSLLSPGIKPKYVAVNRGAQNRPLSEALWPVPRNTLTNDSFVATQEVIRNIQSETGIDSRTMGIEGSKDITKAEAQMIQANSDVRLGVYLENLEQGEKEFWKFIWYRSYREFFSENDVKIVRLTEGIAGSSVVELTQDQFISGINPDVKIESKRKVQAERSRSAAEMEKIMPIYMADQSNPAISKIYFKRKYYRLKGFSTSDIDLFVPPTPEEMKAKRKLALLNQNDISGAKIESVDEDHMTYIVIFMMGKETDAKKTAINLRRRAYEDSLAVKQMQATQESQGNMNSLSQSAGSQLISQASNQ